MDGTTKTRGSLKGSRGPKKDGTEEEGVFGTDNWRRRTARTEGILRVPRGPKKQNISTKMFTRRQNSFIFRIYNVFDMLTT